MNPYTGKFDEEAGCAVVKTLAAFLNTKGGTLIIGVGDGGAALGLPQVADSSLGKMVRHLKKHVMAGLGGARLPLIQFCFRLYGGKHVLLVLCEESEEAVWLQDGNRERFYVRSGSATRELESREATSYIEERRRSRKNAEIRDRERSDLNQDRRDQAMADALNAGWQYE